MKFTCLQCGSTDIVKKVRVVTCGGGNGKSDLNLEVYKDHRALIFKGTHKARLLANVCSECGFVMFRVSTRDWCNIVSVNSLGKG